MKGRDWHALVLHIPSQSVGIWNPRHVRAGSPARKWRCFGLEVIIDFCIFQTPRFPGTLGQGCKGASRQWRYRGWMLIGRDEAYFTVSGPRRCTRSRAKGLFDASKRSRCRGACGWAPATEGSISVNERRRGVRILWRSLVVRGWVTRGTRGTRGR